MYISLTYRHAFCKETDMNTSPEPIVSIPILPTLLLLLFGGFLFDTPALAADLDFVTQEFAPFHYSGNNNTVAGPGAEIVRLVCDRMNATCTIKIFPWSRAQAMVERGEANAMFLIGKNPEREKWLWFSPPVLETEYGFFVEIDDRLQFAKASDINGYWVGVYGPSNTATALTELQHEAQDLHIEMHPTDEAGFRKLENGRIDAVYSNRDVGLSLISQLQLKNIRYAGRHKTLQYYVGFSMQYADRAKVDRFCSAFLELAEEGAIRKILDRYHIGDQRPEGHAPSL